ncbi:MAG: gamma-glutamylcyclotransferase [Acidobacteriota bacterium]
MIRHLFAYGTLQDGHTPEEMSSAVARMKPVGRGCVQGVLYDFGDFPGAVLEVTSNERIAGTIFELPDDAEFLRELDVYEEFYPEAEESSQFLRKVCNVEMQSGEIVACWIYVYNRETAGTRLVARGFWPDRT